MSKKTLILILRLLLSAVAVIIIVNKVDINKAIDNLSKASPVFIFLSLLAYSTSKILAAFRINALYHTQQLFLSQKLNIKLTFLAMFYNLFIPLVGGEGYKSYWINKYYKTPIKSLIWAALLDRGSGLAGLGIVTILVFNWSEFIIPYSEFSLLLIPIIFAAHFLVNKLFFKSFLSAWRKTTFYSLFIQLLQAVTAFFVVQALGIEQFQIEYVFVFMLASFAYVIPIVGAREMAFVFGSQQMGLDMELSLAIGILFYLALAISSLAGSYFVLFPKSLTEEVKFTST
ncbi:MAG: lysylphosphatidylglycerol synthase domain-containing protein [Bacteroidia bacterium]